MSSLALTKGADVFKLGIAVAPVTNWRYYDTVYTEKFLNAGKILKVMTKFTNDFC
jgi:dipeptidyl aminopeptidase/acylaminoacyl peptidase